MIECLSCGFINADKAQQCEKCTSPLLGRDLRCGLYTYGGTSNGQVLQMRYAITRELSSDFTGVKYLAEDVEEKKDVIIWALPIVAGEDEEKIRSLSELCNSLKELTDEHILNVSGFYPEKDVRYVVTEYADGCTLEERVTSEGPLNIETVLELFGPIARSLDIVHRQGFIHGDISPANILISSKGVVKLANFAIGKEIKEMLSRGSSEETIKPSLYMAPEQSENATCSAQSDIYSLAACIYQSLCTKSFGQHGRLQFQELRQDPERLAQLSEKQNEVLLRSLSVNPQDRHSSVVELLTELRDSDAELVVEKEATESELIDYEKSLADLKHNAQEQDRGYEETIKKLIADVEREKQEHAEILNRVQTQARQQAEQQRVDYERAIEQFKAKIAQTEAELASALSESERKDEELAAEKGKASQQSREHKKDVQRLIADAEKAKQEYVEALSQAQTQAEQQRADYERTIEQFKAKIAQTEAELASAMSESERKSGELAAEKEKASQQSRKHEEAVQRLIADAEKAKQEYVEALSQAQTQAEQQRADYENVVEQLRVKVEQTETKLTDAASEASRSIEALTAERERLSQQGGEYEETIKKLAADAEKEKQSHIEVLNQAQTQVEQQRADYERAIEQFKAKIAQTEAELASAMSESERKSGELAVERERASRKNRGYQSTLDTAKAEAKQQQQEFTEQLNQAKWEIKVQNETTNQIKNKAARAASRFKIAIISLASASIVICGIVIGHSYMNVEKYRQAKDKAERVIREMTFSELTRKAAELGVNSQWERAVTTYEKALEINKDVQIENKLKMCRYNLYLSQAITAQQAEDFDKAVALYSKALAYNDNADVRKEIKAVRTLSQIKQLQIISQEWLEPACDFE